MGTDKLLLSGRDVLTDVPIRMLWMVSLCDFSGPLEDLMLILTTTRDLVCLGV